MSNFLEDNNIQYPEGDTSIPYIVENYTRQTVLLEIGAGLNSTRVFSQYFNKMYSIEDNPKYINIYHDNYIHVRKDNSTGWYEGSMFSELIPTDYDLIFLDGPMGGYDPPFNNTRPFRFGFCEINWKDIKKDVTIIVDDTVRPWRERSVVEFLSKNGYSVEDHGQFTVCTPEKQ